MRWGAATVVWAVALAGCASMRPVDVAKPSELTVDQALLDVATGLNNFRQQARQAKTSYGLLVDEVTVDLNVTASATDSSKLVIDAANIAPSVLAGGTLGGSVTAEAGSTAERGNKIIVKLKNVYTAELNAQALKQQITPAPNGQIVIGNLPLMSQPPGSGLLPARRGTVQCNDIQGGDNRQACLDAQRLLNQ